jgi:hypothetical protein
MPISLLPTAPKRTDDPETFIARTDAFLPALNTLVDEINATTAGMNSLAAGGAYALPYKYSINTADNDPAPGWVRFNNSTISSATLIYIDDVGTSGLNYSGLIDQMGNSTNPVKGRIRFIKQGDASKYITFNVTAVTTATGYRKLAVSQAWGSSPSPFNDNDEVIIYFERTGDKGDQGIQGTQGTLTRRATSVNAVTSVTPNSATTELQIITGLTGTVTINAPTGTPVDGQVLLFRIKDNGTSRSVVWNSIYRASPELPILGNTVANKTTYLGFVYNSTDTKWDLLSNISNF